jgi:prepilin-type N-terminal cleavage/methylation domain-containing protein
MQNKLKKMLGLKRADIKRMKKSNNFTLLELLIVVAILAIIAGGVVGSFTNVEENAAQSQAARDIAAVDQGIQTLSAFDSSIPDNVDSLLSAPTTGLTVKTSALNSASGSTVLTASDLINTRVATAIDNRSELPFNPALTKNQEVGGFKGNGGGLAGKVSAQALTARQIENLDLAGISTIRVIAAELDTPEVQSVATPIEVFGTDTALDAATDKYGGINEISIPQNYFEAPRGADNNRGRGFEIELGDVTPTTTGLDGTAVFAVWGGQDAFDPSTNYNTAKLGAAPDAVLVAFGLGPNCTLVGKDAKFGFSSGMPYYANVEKNEYNNYVMLVDVQQRPAKVVAVIDTKGDFRAEEFSEYNDQKL